jgi:methylated-DNA-[protein]-cysteine S-methyltransferase
MFGETIIVFRRVDKKVVRIYLPKQRSMFRSSVYRYSKVLGSNDRYVRNISETITDLLQGRQNYFPLNMLDWSMTSRFQRRVLRMEHKIPRGMVSTYGRLASKLHHPRAARAVGTALARNPFPILIPCHRAIRSDGFLGGYAGGLEMKRRLLELEGIKFGRNGKAMVDRLW